MEFLGYMVGKIGFQFDPSKVEAVSNISEPTGVRQLRKFMDIVNQVGRYIKNFPDMTIYLSSIVHGCGMKLNKKHFNQSRKHLLEHWHFMTRQMKPKSQLMHQRMVLERY